MNHKVKTEDRFLNLISFVAKNKAIIILALLWILMTALSPNVFMTPRNLMNILKQACVYTVIGLGMTCVICSGRMDLSLGSVLCLTGIVMAIMMRDFNMGPAMAIAVGICVGLGCGAINGILSTKFKLNPFIVTLSTDSVFSGFALILSHNQTVTGLKPGFVFLGQGNLFGWLPMLVVVMLIMLVLVSVFLYKTKPGRLLVAVGGNQQAARLSGINADAIGILAYMLSGLMATVAAVMLTARTNGAGTNAGAGMALDAICAVVIGGTAFGGGRANTIGTVIGCIIMSTITNGLTLVRVDPNWQTVAKGVIILTAIIIDYQTERLTTKRMLAALDKEK